MWAAPALEDFAAWVVCSLGFQTLKVGFPVLVTLGLSDAGVKGQCQCPQGQLDWAPLDGHKPTCTERTARVPQVPSPGSFCALP